MHLSRLVIAIVLFALNLPVAASAQSPDGVPVSQLRLVLGPMTVSPRIALTNLGIDTNVFNTPDAPTRDITATVTPGADTHTQLGRASIQWNSEVGWNYFVKSPSQRYLSNRQSLRLDVDLTHVTPYLSGSFNRTRQRPSADIDERVKQTTQRVAGGLAVILGPRTHAIAEAGRQTMRFGDASEGVQFSRALDRTQQEFNLRLTYDASSLTTLTASTAVTSDRFVHSSIRNSHGVAVLVGPEFRPRGLFSGRAQFGFRSFTPSDPALRRYRGPIADVLLSYLMRESTKLAMTFVRNLDYSVDEDAPYIVGTSANVTLNQVVAGDWYAIIRAGRAGFHYQGVVTEGTQLDPSRTDRLANYGLGLGRRVGDSARIELIADYVRRLSSVRTRQYSGMKVGGAVNYGF